VICGALVVAGVVVGAVVVDGTSVFLGRLVVADITTYLIKFGSY